MGALFSLSVLHHQTPVSEGLTTPDLKVRPDRTWGSVYSAPLTLRQET